MGRSTARAGPSQSQRPSQSQKTRTGRRQPHVEEVPEEEDEEEEEEAGEGEEMDVDGEADSEISRKVNALVRLALFTEHRRAVLRRDEINKKVLGSNSRVFNQVFAEAQQKLKSTFGMELAELPTRAGLDQDGAEEGPNEAQLATGVKKKANALGSKTYILRSTLDPVLVEHAAQTEEDILEEEAGDQATLFPALNLSDEEDDSDEDAERIPKYYGSVIAWSKSDQLGSMGILYVILALVLVNGRVIADGDLRRSLKTLHLPSNPAVHPVRHSSSSTLRALSLDTFLSNLLKQGYLDRQQVGGDTGKKGKKSGGGAKRLRTQAEDQEAGKIFEWRWGSRAFSEVGEQNIANFVAEFMVVTDGEGEEDGAAATRSRARQQELMKKMYTGIEKAAGGGLTDLK
ncbi:MAGE family-domain-containing protein [Gymnopilus junonius]|uniref:MAGE family-domain-containing protein n=1 Tax=Gymnopilus junonius TaxID=109634 RepID=A0A9P5NB09_GYMJU|nr:MAGE family-domain-containing protein [Gymnopilus junonius]